jgi:hypothetical protein
MNPCKDCGRNPEHFVSDNLGHVILCSCFNVVQGYRREEYAIEAWNERYGEKENRSK